MPLDRLADRIGQRRDRTDVPRDPRDPLLGQAQAVEQRRVEPALAAGLHVALVCVEDLSRTQLESGGHGLQGAVARAGIEPPEDARSLPRRGADLRYGGGRRSHVKEGTAGGVPENRSRLGICVRYATPTPGGRAAHPSSTK